MRLLATPLVLVLALSGCQTILGIGDTRVAGDGGADPDAPVAQDSGSDAIPAGCVPGTTQCDDCLDNDQDGEVDGFDIHCTTAVDDDESTFSTKIPGDNTDSNAFDCFFDGDSGPGNDGCDVHPCCSLGAATQAQCPINPGTYNPAECTLAQPCIDTCAPALVPGCDCLGCCTLCDETGCRDIQVHPLASPNCTDDFSNDTTCQSCVKKTECAVECGDPASCVLCPGQSADDLPPECAGVASCPGASCEFNSDCSAGELCSNGCCIPPFM